MSLAKTFSEQDHETWRRILSEHERNRSGQVCDLFLEGVACLGLTSKKFPDLNEVNEILAERSGFRGVFVNGLEDGASFYRMLSRREFPVGQFVRDAKDLNYTPAPDIVHDLYGHLPFYTNRAYSDYCQAFAESSLSFLEHPELFRQFERFFWFTIEFGLIETENGRRVFGAGIASSIGECKYALSEEPRVLPFEIDTIRSQEFRIDEMQRQLFILKDANQLYQSLPEFVQRVRDEMADTSRGVV